MSLNGFNLGAKSVQEIVPFLLNIQNHLSSDNYGAGDWIKVPIFTGLTGNPTVTSWYWHLGQLLEVIITLSGTYNLSNAVITNLPYTAKSDGIIQVLNKTNMSNVGNGYIEKNSKNIHLPDLSLTNTTIIIQGRCQISGI